jgi:hypothetical protein
MDIGKGANNANYKKVSYINFRTGRRSSLHQIIRILWCISFTG